jgi:hypothetical protein
MMVPSTCDQYSTPIDWPPPVATFGVTARREPFRYQGDEYAPVLTAFGLGLEVVFVRARWGWAPSLQLQLAWLDVRIGWMYG